LYQVAINTGEKMLNIGDKAPNFNLPDANNNNISLNHFAGKKIVLWFYPKANTPGWIIEGKGFRDEFQKFIDQNIQIIGCSADPPKKQKKFSEKYNFDFPLISDQTHEMLKAYHVWGKKKFLGKEYMGISRMTYIIDETGIIEKVYDKVKTSTHSLDVLKDLT